MTVEQSELELVQSRPFDTPVLGLTAAFETGRGAKHLQISVDPRDLLLQHAGESQTGKLLFAFVYYNADGLQTATLPVSVNANLTAEQPMPQRECRRARDRLFSPPPPPLYREAGRALGLIGVDQVNFQIPHATPTSFTSNPQNPSICAARIGREGSRVGTLLGIPRKY